MRILFLFLLTSFFASGISAQLNVTALDQLQFADIINDVWGYEADGKRYALVGVNTGFAIADVTDAENASPLFFIPGDSTIWRDMKTHENFAYVVSDRNGRGLLVIDLSDLPNSIDFEYLTFGDLEYRTSHNLYIDDGRLYIFGTSRNGIEATLIFDLTENSAQPEFIGSYEGSYVHDGYVRNNLLYTSEINEGDFKIVDVSDVNNLQVLGSFATPHTFTHNAWLSDDGNTLFTTDEVSNGTVSSYDVSNPSDIQFLDSYVSELNNGTIPHNVHVFNDYLVISYYRDGLKIVDASKPDNLVEVGHFDTSPFESGDGFEGNWGAYPFFSNELILATDREEGLFMLQPNYTRAGYLEGSVIDEAGFGIPNARISIVETKHTKPTNLAGDYKTGVHATGNYTIEIEQEGCAAQLYPNVLITKDSLTLRDFTFICEEISTNIIGLKQIGIKTYPNPFTESFTMNTKTPIFIEILDMNGKVVFEGKINQNQTIGSNWSAGVYTINAKLSYQTYSGKIVKR